MGWRNWMRNHVIAAHGVNPSVTEPDLAAAVLAMPPADRVALARELLEGTGKVVAREVEMFAEDRGQSPFERGFDAGWNEAIDAMLGDEG